MITLSQPQKNKLNQGAYSRNGILIIGTDSGDLNSAACWSWALNGGLEAVSNETSVPSIYNGWFTGPSTNPSGINPVFRDGIVGAFPKTQTTFEELDRLISNANKDAGSWKAIRLLLLKLTATIYGYETSEYDSKTSEYAIHMKTDSLCGWDHWGISILMDDGTRHFIQTVAGSTNNLKGIYYKCDKMWDENMPETVIGVDGLQQEHIDVISKIN